MENDWPARLAAQIGQRIADFRSGKKMTGQALTARCRQRGMQLDRAVLSKLETGHRQTLTVGELLVIAAALDVAPINLLLGPVGSDNKIEILPGRRVHPPAAARWLAGEAPLPAAARQDDALTPLVEPEPGPGTWSGEAGLYRAHDHALATWVNATREMRAALAAARAGGDGGATHEAELLRQVRTAAKDTLRRLRQIMREQGVIPPPLPPELADLEPEPPVPPA